MRSKEGRLRNNVPQAGLGGSPNVPMREAPEKILKSLLKAAISEP